MSYDKNIQASRINGLLAELAALGALAGSGTLNYLTKFTPDGNTIGNSQIVDDGTNVGIGESTPTAKLAILTTDNLSTSYGIKIRQNVSGRDLFYIKGNGYSAFKEDVKLAIGGDTSSTARLAIQGVNSAANTDNILICFPYGAATIPFIIKENSNVGVGKQDQTPTARLHVEGIGATSATYALKVHNSASTSLFCVRNDGMVYGGDNSSTSNIYFEYDNGSFKLNTNSTTKMHWDGSELSLHGLNGGTGGGSYLKFTSIPSRGYYLLRSNSSRLGFTSDAGYASMQLSSNGNLFIGTDVSGYDAAARLHVKGSGSTSSTFGLRVDSATVNNSFTVCDDGNVNIGLGNTTFGTYTGVPTVSAMYMGVTPSGSNYFLARNSTNYFISGEATLQFAISGTVYAILANDRFNINQNVGIGLGSTAPSNSLDLIGTSLFKGTNSTSANYVFKLENSSSSPLFSVRNDGNIGIGVAVPSAALDVYNQSNGTNIQVWSANNSAVRAKLTDSGEFLLNIASVPSVAADVQLAVAGRTYLGSGDASNYTMFGRYTLANPYAYLCAVQNATTRGTVGFKFEVQDAGTPKEALIIKANGGMAMPLVQTGNSGLAAGDLYIDTPANIAANGDLVIGMKQ